jgi:hypothetical protein
MPLTPMGFYSKGFPSHQSVLLSESLPSCRWMDMPSTTSMEQRTVCRAPESTHHTPSRLQGFLLL